MLFSRWSSVWCILKPPLLRIFYVLRAGNLTGLLQDAFLNRFGVCLRLRSGLVRDLEVTSLAEALKHGELMKLGNGFFVKLLLTRHADLDQLRLIDMLELVDQEQLGVFQRCLGYLHYRLLLLHALIVLLTRLHYDIVLLPSLPAVIDYLNGAIEVDVAAELQFGLLLLELLRFRLRLNDLTLLPGVFFGFEDFLTLLHLCLHLLLLSRLHLILYFLRCSFLGPLHKLMHLDLLCLLPETGAYLLVDGVELCIH